MGLALHAAFYVLLPVSTYSATMMVLYLALLDPDGSGGVTRHGWSAMYDLLE